MPTLKRDAAPIGDDIEPVEMSKQEMKKNKDPKIVDMLFTGVGVLNVSKVVVLGNIFMLNR